MSSSSEPDFDWSQASSLLGDDPSTVDPDMATIARELVVDADRQFQQLKALDPDTDRKTIGSRAHGLRGCLLNFGFTGVGAILLQVEKDVYPAVEFLPKVHQAEAVFLASKKLLAERYPSIGLG